MKWRECVGVNGFLHETEEKLEAKCDHTLTVRASDLPNTQKDLTVITHDTSIHSSQREAVCTEELAWWSCRRSAGDRWSTESLKVTVDLKAVIPRVSHNHVAVGGEGETLRPVQRIRRRVDVRQEGTAPVKHLMRRGRGRTLIITLTHTYMPSILPRFLLPPHLEQWYRCERDPLTCMRLLPQSATMIFPFTSTATPVGALNWPLPSPFEPNLSRNSPSALNTCK